MNRAKSSTITRAPVRQAPDSAGAIQGKLLSLLRRNAPVDEFTALLGGIKELANTDVPRETLAQSVEAGLALRERLVQQEQRERGLVAVIETSRDLTALRDIELVLQAIVRRARQLVGCTVAYLANYVPERNEFYMRATDGAMSEEMKKLKVSSDFGVIGMVLRTKAPQSSSNYLEDNRIKHLEAVDDAFRREGINSILGVPLLAAGEVLGILFVADRYQRSFLPWEMSILSTLAAHAAVAILNARAFEEARVALRQAGEANAMLQAQAEGIRLAAEAHEQLTSVVAKGGGLQDLGRIVADKLRGRVLVLDEGGRPITPVLEAGSGPDERALWKVDDHLKNAMRESRMLGRSVVAHASGPEICRVSAVVGGSGLLGWMVIKTPAELNEFEIRIFERSAIMAGIVLLSQERMYLAVNRDRSAILRGLLYWQQDDLAGLSDRATRHGLDLSKPVVLAAIEVDAGRASQMLKQMKDLPGLGAMLSDEIDGLLVVLTSPASPEALSEVLRSNAKGPPITAVVSKPVKRVSDLPRVYQSLKRCMGLMRSLDRKGSVSLESELSPYALLFEKQGSEDVEVFLKATVGKLLDYDRKRSCSLAETILCYLDNGHNARRTAAKLGIHVNTLRQRFETIQKLLDGWSDTTRALEIHLALRLWQLRGGRRPAQR
jgi:GAF domain-containing protein/sugar diacid utilization regulator